MVVDAYCVSLEDLARNEAVSEHLLYLNCLFQAIWLIFTR